MKTNLAHLAMAFFALGAILCSACSGNIKLEKVKSAGGLLTTSKSYIPITGTIVEKYKHPETGKRIVRKIELNGGKVESVKDFIKGKQLFKDYPHEVKICKGIPTILESLYCLTEDMRDTAYIYHDPNLESSPTGTDCIYFDGNLIKEIEHSYNTMTVSDKIQEIEQEYEAQSGQLLRFKDLKTNQESFYDGDGKVWKFIKCTEEADTTFEHGEIAYINDHVKQLETTYKNGRVVKVKDNIKQIEKIYENGKVARLNDWAKRVETIYQNGVIVQKNNKNENTESIYQNGRLAKVYHLNSKGERTKEVIYRNGRAVKTNILIVEPTLFNNYGMELTTYKTGFFPTWNAFNPMVILKLKNISSRNLTWDDDRIKVTATFISEGEELGSDYCYIPSSSDAPWNPGISRQIYFKSNWTAMYDTAMKSKITCKIYIDNQLCKSFEIENKILTSNRIQ